MQILLNGAKGVFLESCGTAGTESFKTGAENLR